MSNHFSADNLRFPGDDRRLDLTDVFVFPSPAGEVLARNFPVSFDASPRPVQAGRIRLAAGLRSDPFFADVVCSHRFAGLTHGKAGPTGLKPHTDLLGELPYLGSPNP